jgi:hypothetical protein
MITDYFSHRLEIEGLTKSCPINLLIVGATQQANEDNVVVNWIGAAGNLRPLNRLKQYFISGAVKP